MKTASIVLLAGLLGCASVQQVWGANAVTFKEKVLHSFCSQQNCTDGTTPIGGLLDVNGILYGTTAAGGNAGCDGSGCGTVFSIDPGTGTETVLYSFCSKKGCNDGAAPTADLVDVNGILYGTTENGGGGSCGNNYGCGTVFSFNPSTGAERALYSFCSKQNCADGQEPFAGLIKVKEKLYGTTPYGGSNYYGTVFSLDLNTGTEEVVYSFCNLGGDTCTDGANPVASLIDLNGMLYGTTNGGGSNGGTVFAIDPTTGAETVVHSFCSQAKCADGAYPFASLIDVKGMLYGTTDAGGGSAGCAGVGCGTVYSIDPTTGNETVLYAFLGGTDGANPQTALIDVNGLLYGTTPAGGVACNGYGCGVVFSLDPSIDTETVLYSFCREQNCSDGKVPSSPVLAMKGNLYGTTRFGGIAGCGGFGCGTLFVLKKKR